MLVTLIVKPDAGDGDHEIDKIVARMEKAGHEVIVGRRKDNWKELLERSPDLVLIGGGDGTVGKVARALTSYSVPFATLPLGTANNVAHQLGWIGKPTKLLKDLDEAIETSFDIGLAAGPWGSWQFIESVGIGPFARTMALLTHTAGEIVKDPTSRNKALKRDLKMLDAVLMESHAERCEVEIDGSAIEGNIILVEVMNISRIGPNVALAPDARVDDGAFDVVTATEADRDRLHDYIAARLDDDESILNLPVRRAKHVRLTVESTRVHIDDTLWPAADEPLPAAGAPYTIDISVQAGRLTALTMPDH